MSRDRRKFNRAALVVLMALAATLWLAAPRASAGEFVDRPCEDRYDAWNPHWYGSLDTIWWLRDKCSISGTMELQMMLDSEPFQWPGFFQLEYEDATIRSVRVAMFGSSGVENGLRQGLMACAEICNFDKIVTLDAAHTEDLEVHELTAENQRIPENATRLVIAGDCVAEAGCVGPPLPEEIELEGEFEGPWLGFRDFELTLEDTTKPTMSFALYHDGQPVTDATTHWLSTPPSFVLSSEDPGSGIGAETIAANGNWPFWDCNFRTRSYNGSCWPGEEYRGVINTWQLQQGTNTLVGEATNRAGESVNEEFSFRYDDVAPDPPSAIRVSPGLGNVSSSRQVTVAWNNTGETGENDTESGVRAVRYDVDPVGGGDDVIEERVDEFEGPSGQLSVVVPWNGDWSLTLSTIDAAGNESDSREFMFSVDDRKADAPRVDPLPSLSAADAATGRTVEWQQPGGGSWLCGTFVSLNASPAADPADDPAAVFVGPAARSFHFGRLVLLGLSDGLNYVHLQARSCAGVVGEATHAPLAVDLTAPEVDLFPSSGWLTDGSSATIAATEPVGADGQSGVASITYWLDGDRLNPTTVDAAVASVDLPQGKIDVTFLATDQVGNSSAEQTVTVSVDSAAPTVALGPTEPANPLAISATATDPQSGVRSLRLELRPAGGAWQQVGERAVVAGGAGSLTVHGRIPDDGELAPGAYELRAVADDVAGHSAVSSVRPDGSPAAFASPVRAAATLTAALTGAKSPKVSNSSIVTDFAEPSTLHGVLRDTGGAPLPGANLQVLVEPENGLVQVTQIQTTPTGEYRLPLAAGVNRTITVRFVGSATHRRASALVRQSTRSQISLRVKARKVVGSRKAIFRGRVTLGDAQVPRRGKIVVIEIRSGRSWTSPGWVRRTTDDGRFEAIVTLPGSRNRTFKVRAHATEESGWPYAAGVSKSVSVRYRP